LKLQELHSTAEMQQKALEAAEEERTTLKTQVQELEAKLAKAEEDNKMLVDRWMQQKMQDAERLNEVGNITSFSTHVSI
jgi:autophagy-related protein 16